MPQRKKDPSVRNRRNKAATKATLRRVPADATPTESYAEMTVADLQSAIDQLNTSRPADQQLPRRGRKAELVEVLTAAARNIPDLPAHPPRYDDEGNQFPLDWHAQTVSWWNDVWTSPMAEEWDDSDLHNVFVVALLYDDIWTATTPKQRKEALAEYRLQRSDLGLSPYSRRRLEWTIETAAEAKERGEKRRTNGRVPPPAPAKGEAPKADPRAHLAAVK